MSVNNTTHKLRWYQNGVFKTGTDISGHAFGTNTNADLTLGSSYNGTGEFLTGYMDETRIYNRVLSDSEIEDLASGESGVDVPTETPTPIPTLTPTPTPTPTSTPIPTPTPTSMPVQESSSSPSSPSSSQNQCSDEIPESAPDLFQISTSLTAATLFFTPVSPATGYIISYGTTSEADQYSTAFDHTNEGGAVSYTVHALSQGKKYYFRVQAKNNCATGKWSQVKDQTTTTTTTSSNSFGGDAGSIEVTHKEQTSSRTKTVSPEPSNTSAPKQAGYDLVITVLNNGKPVEGATV
ncbi:MAG TPA: LamG-like jellyroll fold domain-containing protein, partial [Allocoleopsis sp.]